jgi:hypothetical protein
MRAKEMVVLSVLAWRVDEYSVVTNALPDESVLVKIRDELKFTIAVEGNAPIAVDTEEMPIASVEKFQPDCELRVDM